MEKNLRAREHLTTRRENWTTHGIVSSGKSKSARRRLRRSWPGWPGTTATLIDTNYNYQRTDDQTFIESDGVEAFIELIVQK